MSDLSQAIAAKETEISSLQADFEALQRAASIIGSKRKSPGGTFTTGC